MMMELSEFTSTLEQKVARMNTNHRSYRERMETIVSLQNQIYKASKLRLQQLQEKIEAKDDRIRRRPTGTYGIRAPTTVLIESLYRNRE